MPSNCEKADAAAIAANTCKSKTVKCTEPFVREESVDQQLSNLLSQFTLRSDWASEMLVMVGNEQKQANEVSRALAIEKQADIAKIDEKMQRLLEAYLDQLVDRETFASQKKDLMSKKKVLQEQIIQCEDNQIGWVEPFKEWINTAKTLSEVAERGSLADKKALSAKVFGSNLILDSKKARGSASKPFSFIPESTFSGGMVPRGGFEPTTN